MNEAGVCKREVELARQAAEMLEPGREQYLPQTNALQVAELAKS